MTPEAIPLGIKELLKVDVQRRDYTQLSEKTQLVGRYCSHEMNKTCFERTTWVENMYTSLREGYMKSQLLLPCLH